MERDTEIFNFINKEYERQINGIELIASENYVSKNVLNALGSICTNKYAEGYPGHRYYGGCQYIDKIEQLAIDRLKKIYNVEYANVQPHSGAQANMAVMMTCLNPGDTFMGLDLAHGGHLTHGSSVNVSGILYNAISYKVNKETGIIDYDEMEELAIRYNPKLIIGGASAYSREWDYKRMREIANKVGAILWIDMAHTAGLIAAGLLENPAKYAHIVTSTTHKTLRGPRGGIILIGKDFDNPYGIKDKKGNIKKMSQLIDSKVFPGVQGGPLEHCIAAKAVSFYEAMQPEFIEYQKQILLNSKTMCEEFKKLGYKIVSNGTDNHMFLLDLRTKFPDITGKEAENELSKVDITVNKNMVPYDDRSPFQTSGIRIGTPAITTRGFKEKDMIDIVSYIDIILCNLNSKKMNKEITEYDLIISDIKEKVNNKAKKFPLNN